MSTDGVLPRVIDDLDSAYFDDWVRELQIGREWQAAWTAAGCDPAAN